MKDGFIRVAATGPKLKLADCSQNAKEIIKQIEVLNENNAKLIVFPELCITGYSCGDLFLQRTLLENALEALKDIVSASFNSDALIAIGMPLDIFGKLFNCGVIIKGGKILGVVPKTFIPNYTEYYEVRHFTSAMETSIREIKLMGSAVPFGTDLIFKCENIQDFNIAFEICEDLWAPNSPSIDYALGGATVIANLSASNEILGKAKYRENLVKMQSAKLLSAYIYSSSGYGESTTDLIFSGQKLIAENGVLLARTKNSINDIDTIITADIDFQVLNHERRRTNTFKPIIKNEFRFINFTCEEIRYDLNRNISKTPFVPSIKEDRDERCEEIISLQANGLMRRIEHIYAKKLVIGISGGLDSTLALLVLAKALNELNRSNHDIIAVTMPGFGTTGRTYSNAKKLIEYIGAEFREINIKADVQSHFKTIGHNGEPDVTFENAQARERMQILMDIANMENGIVVGTPDLSEIALGFSTYNGDHMSMYGVNSGVPKTLIRYLINSFAEKSEDELKNVLLDIIDTPVSPELLPHQDGKITQKTESIIGDYLLHDFILFYFIRYGFSKEKILRLLEYAFSDTYNEETLKNTLDTFFKRFFANQFKRSCMPDGPKIGSVSLSPRGDFRMPSDCQNFFG
jgi:NAD+ synthase (glutamine-hydrolysing)